ncbi:thioesterase II family protein [Actinospica robiniae]|uniref:thioesterase II family protein n=1 Tax=Actinospica robiniae TaxID=304901 RepID=UPI000418E0C5|nr:alpha/beta fold hydrolase [Actinospica robiniae]
MSKRPDWIFPLRKAGGAPSCRLVVFPYAAAGASALRPLVTLLPDSVELLGVALPGRERRFGEPAATTFPEIMRGVVDDLAARPELPTFLLGHSLGASLAVALARSVPEICSGIIVSARRPAHVALAPILAMSDEEVGSFLDELGNTAPQLLGEPYWRDRLIQLFRHDTELDIEASHVAETRLLTQPLTVLAGSEDPYVDVRDLDAWAARTSGHCDIRIYPGDHFFLLDPGNLAVVADALSAFIGGVSGIPGVLDEAYS